MRARQRLMLGQQWRPCRWTFSTCPDRKGLTTAQGPTNIRNENKVDRYCYGITSICKPHGQATLFSIQTLVVCAEVEMGKQVAATGAGGGCEFRGYRRRLAAQRWRSNLPACRAVLADEKISSAKP